MKGLGRKSIMVWGEGIEEAFKRLGFTHHVSESSSIVNWMHVYEGIEGYGEGKLSVYLVCAELFKALCDDNDEWWESEECKCYWRYAKGAVDLTRYGHGLSKQININHKYMIGFTAIEGYGWGKKVWTNIFEYMCDELGASTERNVTALCVELARMNKMNLWDFLNKYNMKRVGA